MENETFPPETLYRKQIAFFKTGTTRELDYRRAQIKRLVATIRKYEPRIIEAQRKDFHKSAMASYSGDMLAVLQEAKYVLRNLKKWSRPWREGAPIFLPATQSSVQREPYGSVLIITPYNVPFIATFTLLIGALGAGNCATVKVSEIATHSGQVALDIIREAFSPEYVAGVTGDATVSQQLLDEPYDFVFFMGSTAVGKSVMAACAKHLSPVVLQLGGKCPAIVDENVSIDSAAKRIVWGKFLNAGQECVAVDHVYVHADRKDALIAGVKKYIRKFYGEDPQKSPDYERIINEKYFNHITQFLNEGRIIAGGKTDLGDLYIEPTVIDSLPENGLAAREEIFGPILPIFTYESPEVLFAEIGKRPSPLAVYVFSNDVSFQQRVARETISGTTSINDALVHNASFYVPVGGVGQSGFGRIHGRYTFETFSRLRTTFKRNPWLDVPGRYPPSNEKILPFLKRIFG